MRNPIPFDTHAYVKRLIAAGMPEAQAEVQAEALSEVVLAQIATKEDVRQTVERLRAGLCSFERRLEVGINSFESRMKSHLEVALLEQRLWFLTSQVALFVALLALFKLA